MKTYEEKYFFHLGKSRQGCKNLSLVFFTHNAPWRKEQKQSLEKPHKLNDVHGLYGETNNP